MIDSIMNLLFRCSHKRLTRPVTPISREGRPQGDTYVACLDCGKQFSYDAKQMKIGKPLGTPAPTGGSLGMALGSLLTPRKKI